jgi:RNA polymerase sigma-70 factor, ECF subfamily
VARASEDVQTSTRSTSEAVWGYREDVWSLARQLCGHREDAEDVTQSTLLKAVQHLDGFRWEASLRTWLHRIATNECRMLRRQKTPASLDEMLDAVTAGERSAGEPSDHDPGPEELAEEAEARRRVVAALAELPEHYRTVLLLKDGLGLRATDLAQATGTSVPAAKATLHRARRALRSRIEASVSRS